MDRENLQAELQNIPKLGLEDRIEAYEELFEEVDVEAVERFPFKNGEETVVMEVKRRIWTTYRIAKNLELEDLQRRAKSLLKNHFE